MSEGPECQQPGAVSEIGAVAGKLTQQGTERSERDGRGGAQRWTDPDRRETDGKTPQEAEDETREGAGRAAGGQWAVSKRAGPGRPRAPDTPRSHSPAWPGPRSPASPRLSPGCARLPGDPCLGCFPVRGAPRCAPAAAVRSGRSGCALPRCSAARGCGGGLRALPGAGSGARLLTAPQQVSPALQTALSQGAGALRRNGRERGVASSVAGLWKSSVVGLGSGSPPRLAGPAPGYLALGASHPHPDTQTQSGPCAQLPCVQSSVMGHSRAQLERCSLGGVQGECGGTRPEQNPVLPQSPRPRMLLVVCKGAHGLIVSGSDAGGKQTSYHVG